MFSLDDFLSLFSDKVGKTICLADGTSLISQLKRRCIHAAHHDKMLVLNLLYFAF